MFRKIAEQITQFVKAIFRGDGLALGILFVLFLFTVCLRVQGSKKIELPEAAHNVVGDIPMAEQFDDGYVSPVQEKPNDIKKHDDQKNSSFEIFYTTVSRNKKSPRVRTSGILFSYDGIAWN